MQGKLSVQDKEMAQAHLAAIVASCDDAIISKDLQGIITSWNPAAQSVFGYSAEEAVGKSVTMLIPEHLLDEETTIISRIRRGESVDHYQTVRRRKDGRLLAVSLTVSPIRDSSGRIIGASKIARDITELKQGAEAKRLLAAIVESSEDVVISKSLDGIITSWNGAAERLFGYTAAEAVGQPIRLIIPADRLPEEERILERLRKGERVEHFETLRARRDGTMVPVSLTVSPIRDDEGSIVGVSKIARDISEKQRAERELTQTTQRLRDAQVQLEKHAAELEGIVMARTVELRATVADLEAFSYSISHDLRAPLRAMQGFAQLLHQNCGSRLDEEGRLFLDKIIRAGTRLNQLIEDVLSYSRIGRLDLELGPNSLDQLVPRVIDEYPHILQANPDITLQRPLKPVIGSETLLVQCIANLLGNAVKFVPSGTRPRINVRTESRNGSVRLWVEDNGVGIPEEERHKIFGLFARGASNSHIDGTGIGLAVVQRAVIRMQGQVGVESKPGHGSRFWIQLPAVQ